MNRQQKILLETSKEFGVSIAKLKLLASQVHNLISGTQFRVKIAPGIYLRGKICWLSGECGDLEVSKIEIGPTTEYIPTEHIPTFFKIDWSAVVKFNRRIKDVIQECNKEAAKLRIHKDDFLDCVLEIADDLESDARLGDLFSDRKNRDYFLNN